MAHCKCLRRRAAVSMFILCGLVLFTLSRPVFGESARQLYFKGEACYQELSDHPAWQKYRARWKKCIEKFEKVHALNPDGPWAAAGLYMTGKLYAELYQHSYSPKDIQAARSIFSEIISTYPHSQYKVRAQKAMARLPEVKSEPEASAKQAYFEAEACYKDLRQHPERQAYRVYWKNCIDRFAAVYQAHPDDSWAPAAMFMTARLYEELYSHSYSLDDKEKAADIYERLTHTYPESEYRGKAQAKLDQMPDAIADAIAHAGSETDGNPSADKANNSDHSSMATVTGIRYWSNAEYTRVVVDATKETSFQNNLLKKDPAINKPYQRLYVDLNNTRLGAVEKKIPINDNLLRAARAAQYRKDMVRVVVDIKSFEDYNIFSLKNPFRIVIDVRGERAAPKIASKVAPEDSIVKSLNLGVNRIVIDPGHGGKDYGAPGYLRGVHEKDVVLEISRKLAEMIETQIGCEVLMTRKTDKYLTLEERTAIANTENADLFISVHANAARNHRAFGIETYFLNLTTDEEAIAVAARENSTSRKNISELDSILQDLLNNAKINESSRLATYVQDSLCGHLAGNYSRINNKGVKQAPFYVLLGAQMPSILVETSFVSNQRECRRLTDPAYQSELCEGIVSGLSEYIKEIQPKANYGPQHGEDAGS
ncbi:MAG TPA: N-acetylmuramoyl-L-alanine amidase [Desulfosalsimonadaceae bacterium]|nr:N-acetylmuramoyl-L-alanine amidase [Desulfosalsimonadaceae bacterium]